MLNPANIVDSFKQYFQVRAYLAEFVFREKKPEPNEFIDKNYFWVNFIGIRPKGAFRALSGNPTDAYDLEVGIIVPYNKLADLHDDTDIGEIVRQMGEDFKDDFIEYYSGGIQTGRMIYIPDVKITFEKENEVVFKIACE